MPKVQMPQLPGPPRFIMVVFGLVFAGAGLCFIGLIWSDESSFVPVFARIFGSLIALACVAFGGTMAFAGVKSGGMSINLPDGIAPASTSSASPATYTCPHCGGGLQANADVSPLGDTKCPFCGRWFNVHGKN